MKIEGQNQAPETRRFSAGKPAAPKEGGKSFGALLKKAEAQAAPRPAVPAPAPAPVAAAPKPAESAAVAEAAAKDPEAAFADHMETVRFRLKTGYYSSKAIDDALSEKLTGYFDDLA